MTQTEYALIVAGGKGTRIKSKLPKQFLELHGKPVILHTLEAFYRYSDKIQVILVLPEDDLPTWHEIAKKFSFHKPLTLQSGGSSRFQSVKKGLDKIQGEGLVAIHDGVRPLVTEALISASFRLAAVQQSAVAAVRLKESIRMTDEEALPEGNAGKQGYTRAVDRSKFRLIQTPQTFSVHLIKNAYAIDEDPGLTDDASVAERAGYPIALFEGAYENIKITTPEDLLIAEALLKK